MLREELQCFDAQDNSAANANSSTMKGRALHAASARPSVHDRAKKKKDTFYAETNTDLAWPLEGLSDKQIKRLKRVDLLEILVAQGEEIEALRKEIQVANEQLADKEIKIAESGNLADAVLKLNAVFEAAQAAADQYVQNIKSSHNVKVSE